MALWGNKDNAANSTIWAAAQVHLAPNSTNRTALFNNTTPDDIIEDITVGQFAIDVTEQQQSVASSTERPAHAGWVLRTEGSGGRAGRVFYETLVAMGSISGDSSNTVLPQQAIVVSSAPTSKSANTNDTTSFTVTASLVPSGGSIVYKWQVDGVDAPNGALYSGNSTSTLSIANTAGLNGKKYRVVLSKAGATTVTTANATLTVV